MSPSEINPERIEKYKAWEKLSFLPKLIILVGICAIASAISWFRAEYAIDENKDLKAEIIGLQATTATWQLMYKETERECRLAQLELDDMKIIMIRAGLDVEHDGESP